ncbi:MAG: hypothetical protein HYU36_15810 [Planctomycetes bacterium]|nr:hypothetical protein [Planctomycetota bacterium]
MKSKRSESQSQSPVTIESNERVVPPRWAVMERYLIEQMNRAAVQFVERYTRPDGTLVWRQEWPGMDGSDDAYESFTSFPLFYALGGSEAVHELSRKEWSAITWQFTGYGQVYREFDAYYDWMHHGESNLYLYYFGLADPYRHQDRDRALRFAAMYTGDDPESPNWDAKRKMIRSPINGSRGPRFEMSAVDWVTHRPILAEYLAPYEDMAGLPKGDPWVKANWNDDAVFARILKLLNQRMARGDVPLNLNATSLVTHAYLYTGDERYRQWVLDYLAAWCQRTKKNKGIMPDNVGPTGKIGECMKGKWWGGYYGWRWPHGSYNILESTLMAGENAVLMTGDASWLDLTRSQHDLMWSLGRVENGVFKVPWKHGDQGWFAFNPPNPRNYIHLYFTSLAGEDRERLERLENRDRWPHSGSFSKGGQYNAAPWFAYVQGNNPDFPDRVLSETHIELCRRLELMRNDHADPETWDVHHWQEINPVVCEGMAQLMLGSPAAIYHGGLLHASVRYFDPASRRPGLPQHVAAAVERVSPDALVLVLVNTDALQASEVLVQAGAYAEHQFTEARRLDASGKEVGNTRVHARHVLVRLGPGAQARLKLGVRRYAHAPSYDLPWKCNPCGIQA